MDVFREHVISQDNDVRQKEYDAKYPVIDSHSIFN